MDSLMLMMDLLVAGYGLYGLKSWFDMKRAGKLLENKVIYPSNGSVQTCKEPEAYYTFIMPRLLIMSLGAATLGLFNLTVDLWSWLPMIVSYIANGLFFAVLIWFGVVIYKSTKRYF